MSPSQSGPCSPKSPANGCERCLGHGIFVRPASACRLETRAVSHGSPRCSSAWLGRQVQGHGPTKDGLLSERQCPAPQMAILVLPLHFTCFLCQFVAADRAQLKKHLTTLHSFPCHDWTPARDSLKDQVTCAHCWIGASLSASSQEAHHLWTLLTV